MTSLSFLLVCFFSFCREKEKCVSVYSSYLISLFHPHMCIYWALTPPFQRLSSRANPQRALIFLCAQKFGEDALWSDKPVVQEICLAAVC